MKHEPKPIGELNGFWSVMFRASLMAFPIFASVVIAWATWVTKEIFRHDTEIAKQAGTIEEVSRRAAESRADIKALEFQRRIERTP